MIQEVYNLKEELTFENLYNYLYQIYLNGEYRKIAIKYTDFSGAKYITIASSNYFSEETVSLYEIMNENNPLEERNCIRHFDKEGDYNENFDLKHILSFFNNEYSDQLRAYHKVELKDIKKGL